MIKNVLAIVFILALATGISAQDYKYIGAAKCKMCHVSAKAGKQYTIWQSGPHAKAYSSLASEKSKEYAQKNGIADPQKEQKCLKCHATTESVDKNSLMPSIKVTEGVSCESCHGPGSKYKSMAIMKDQKKSLENGLILPTEEVCKKCHNPENPFHKEFDYKTFSEKIAHPTPKE